MKIIISVLDRHSVGKLTLTWGPEGIQVDGHPVSMLHRSQIAQKYVERMKAATQLAVDFIVNNGPVFSSQIHDHFRKQGISSSRMIGQAMLNIRESCQRPDATVLTLKTSYRRYFGTREQLEKLAKGGIE